jgi:hypothetical protein
MSSESPKKSNFEKAYLDLSNRFKSLKQSIKNFISPQKLTTEQKVKNKDIIESQYRLSQKMMSIATALLLTGTPILTQLQSANATILNNVPSPESISYDNGEYWDEESNINYKTWLKQNLSLLRSGNIIKVTTEKDGVGNETKIAIKGGNTIETLSKKFEGQKILAIHIYSINDIPQIADTANTQTNSTDEQELKTIEGIQKGINQIIQDQTTNKPKVQSNQRIENKPSISYSEKYRVNLSNGEVKIFNSQKELNQYFKNNPEQDSQIEKIEVAKIDPNQKGEKTPKSLNELISFYSLKNVNPASKFGITLEKNGYQTRLEFKNLTSLENYLKSNPSAYKQIVNIQAFETDSELASKVSKLDALSKSSAKVVTIDGSKKIEFNIVVNKLNFEFADFGPRLTNLNIQTETPYLDVVDKNGKKLNQVQLLLINGDTLAYKVNNKDYFSLPIKHVTLTTIDGKEAVLSGNGVNALYEAKTVDERNKALYALVIKNKLNPNTFNQLQFYIPRSEIPVINSGPDYFAYLKNTKFPNLDRSFYEILALSSEGNITASENLRFKSQNSPLYINLLTSPAISWENRKEVLVLLKSARVNSGYLNNLLTNGTPVEKIVARQLLLLSSDLNNIIPPDFNSSVSIKLKAEVLSSSVKAEQSNLYSKIMNILEQSASFHEKIGKSRIIPNEKDFRILVGWYQTKQTDNIEAYLSNRANQTKIKEMVQFFSTDSNIASKSNPEVEGESRRLGRRNASPEEIKKAETAFLTVAAAQGWKGVRQDGVLIALEKDGERLSVTAPTNKIKETLGIDIPRSIIATAGTLLNGKIGGGLSLNYSVSTKNESVATGVDQDSLLRFKKLVKEIGTVTESNKEPINKLLFEITNIAGELRPFFPQILNFVPLGWGYQESKTTVYQTQFVKIDPNGTKAESFKVLTKLVDYADKVRNPENQVAVELISSSKFWEQFATNYQNGQNPYLMNNYFTEDGKPITLEDLSNIKDILLARSSVVRMDTSKGRRSFVPGITGLNLKPETLRIVEGNVMQINPEQYLSLFGEDLDKKALDSAKRSIAKWEQIKSQLQAKYPPNQLPSFLLRRDLVEAGISRSEANSIVSNLKLKKNTNIVTFGTSEEFGFSNRPVVQYFRGGPNFAVFKGVSMVRILTPSGKYIYASVPCGGNVVVPLDTPDIEARLNLSQKGVVPEDQKNTFAQNPIRSVATDFKAANAVNSVDQLTKTANTLETVRNLSITRTIGLLRYALDNNLSAEQFASYLKSKNIPVSFNGKNLVDSYSEIAKNPELRKHVDEIMAATVLTSVEINANANSTLTISFGYKNGTTETVTKNVTPSGWTISKIENLGNGKTKVTYQRQLGGESITKTRDLNVNFSIAQKNSSILKIDVSALDLIGKAYEERVNGILATRYTKLASLIGVSYTNVKESNLSIGGEVDKKNQTTNTRTETKEVINETKPVIGKPVPPSKAPEQPGPNNLPPEKIDTTKTPVKPVPPVTPLEQPVINNPSPEGNTITNPVKPVPPVTPLEQPVPVNPPTKVEPVIINPTQPIPGTKPVINNPIPEVITPVVNPTKPLITTPIPGKVTPSDQIPK